MSIENQVCIIKGCTNKKDQGTFQGDICSPCYKIITKGDLKQPSNNFIHKLACLCKNIKGVDKEGLEDISNVIMFSIMEKEDLQLDGPEYISLRNTIHDALMEWYND